MTFSFSSSCVLMVTLSDMGDEGETMEVERGEGKARWPHPSAVTAPSGKCSLFST